MGTKSFIGLEYPDNTIKAIYCHWDGYVHGGVGETLLEWYKDIEKVKGLISLGSLSVLRKSIEKVEGLNMRSYGTEKYADYSLFYTRDGGGKFEQYEFNTEEEYFNFFKNGDDYIDYAYLFKSNEWHISIRDKHDKGKCCDFTPLREHFKKEVR